MTPHASITAPGDVVACDVHRATLPALACARRHVARDERGHRYLRMVGAEARWPTCASCPLGAVARERLGVRGTPGAVPRVAVDYGQRRVAETPLRPRATPSRDRARALPEDVADVHRSVVPHPADAFARGLMPWGRL